MSFSCLVNLPSTCIYQSLREARHRNIGRVAHLPPTFRSSTQVIMGLFNWSIFRRRTSPSKRSKTWQTQNSLAPKPPISDAGTDNDPPQGKVARTYSLSRHQCARYISSRSFPVNATRIPKPQAHRSPCRNDRGSRDATPGVGVYGYRCSHTSTPSHRPRATPSSAMAPRSFSPADTKADPAA